MSVLSMKQLPVCATCTLALALPISHAFAQGEVAATASVPVVVIVRVASPWYVPNAFIKSKMRDSIGEYSNLAGLNFKAYSLAQTGGDFGGIYLWRDAQSAGTWFNPAWFERIRKERGVEAQVRTFEAPLSIDNTPGGTLADDHSATVSTLVEIAIPAGVTRERIVAGFADSVPTYTKVPGLMRKYFTISQQGTFGGVYLWKDELSARAWFNTEWHERVRKTYGRPAKIEWFDTPILLPSKRAENALPANVLITAKP